MAAVQQPSLLGSSAPAGSVVSGGLPQYDGYNIWATNSNATNCYRSDEPVNRLITRTGSGSWQAVRAMHGYTRGRVTIDFTIIHASNLMVGAVPATFNAWNTYLGSAAGGGVSYRCNGNLRVVNDGSRTTGHASFASGSLVRMILDFDNQHVEYIVNGASQGQHEFAKAGLAGTALYPAISTHDEGEAVRLTAPLPLPPLLAPAQNNPSIASAYHQPLPVAMPPMPKPPGMPSSSPSPPLPPSVLSTTGAPHLAHMNNLVDLPPPPPPIPGGVLRQPTGFPNHRHAQLINEIRRVTLPLNILVFGPAGGAKSTLINTLTTALSPPADSIRSFAHTLNQAGHVSTDLRKYRLPNSNISLWDPWGWTGTNFSSAELPFMLNGHMADGFKMGGVAAPGAPAYHSNPGINEMVHGVIIVIASDVARSELEGKDFWQRFKSFRSQINERGLFGLVALTKMDLIDSKLIHEPAAVYSSIEANRVCGAVAERTGYDPRRVIPCKLYHTERERSVAVESLALEALAEAVQQAETFYLQRSPAAAAATGSSAPPPSSIGSKSDGSGIITPLPADENERHALAMLSSLGFGQSGHGYLYLYRAFGKDLQRVIDHLVQQKAHPFP